MAEFIKKPCTRRDVQRLDDLLIKENISPGGCADLLAFTLFVHRMSAIG
jgi:triphosphoribosyl-dephospho-CoA synthetase